MPPLAWGLAPIRRSPVGRQLRQLRQQPAVLVEQLLGPVALHPALELGDVFGVLGVHQERHLVGSERALDRQAVDDLGPRPALGGASTIIGQRGRAVSPPSRALPWILPDVLDGLVQARPP